VPFRLTSPAFDDGARLPVPFTCEGEDISPALGWEGAPTATRSATDRHLFALTLSAPRHTASPDAPVVVADQPVRLLRA